MMPMAQAHPPNWLDKAMDQHEAAIELISMLRGQDEFTGMKLLDVLKSHATRDVFALRLRGQKYVLKRFKGPQAAQTALETQRELARQAPRMSQGPFQVNKCLLERSDLGIVLLSYANGVRVDDALKNAGPRRRAKIFRHAGAWLQVYTEPLQTQKTFGPGYWVRQRARMGWQANEPDKRESLRALLHHMEQQSERFSGCSVTHSGTHGDFSGINLHYQNGVMTGVDIQGQTMQAIARDAATFLVWQAIRQDFSGPRICGIPAPDWIAFNASGVLPEGEKTTSLPFFISEQLFIRLQTFAHKDPIRARTLKAIAALLSDLNGGN